MTSLYGRYSLPVALKLIFISAFTLLLFYQGYRNISKELDSNSPNYLSANGEEDFLEDDFDVLNLFIAEFSSAWESYRHRFILANLLLFILTSCLYQLHCVYRL